MKQHSLTSPRRTLALVLALGVLVIGGLWAGIVMHTESRQRLAVEQVRHDVSNLAIALEEQARRTFASIDQVIRFAQAEFAEAPDEFDLPGWARRAVSLDEIALQIAMANADGTVVASTLPQPPGPPVSIADREHFRIHARSTEDMGLFVSRPTLGRVSGRWTIQFSRRLSRADGSFAGVIVVSVDPDYLSRSFGSIDVGSQGSVSLFHRGGAVLARNPAVANMFDQNLREDPSSHDVYEALLRQGSLSRRTVSAVDGVERFLGYRTLGELPLIVAVGKSVDEALAPVRRERLGVILTGALLSVGFAVGLALLARELEHRRRREHELAIANDALAFEKNRFRRSSSVLQATLENMDQGLMVIDRAGTVQICNRRACELLDLPPDMMNAGPAFRAVVEYQLGQREFDGNDEQVQAWVNAGGLEEGYHRYERERPNGIILEIITVRQPDGSAIRTYTDITARRQAERANSETEERYRLLAENASDIIVLQTLGPQGRIVYVSPACKKVLGYPPEEFDTATGLVHRDDMAERAATIERHALGLARSTHVHRLRHKDGRWIWVESVSQRVEGAAEPTLISSIRDVTERQEQAEELVAARDIAELALAQARHASQAKTDFLASMSHEIRTPLNGVLGYADMLAEDPSLRPEQRRHAERIQSAGSALLTVVNDILDFSKIEAGQVELDSVPFSPMALVDNAVSIVTSQAARKGLDLRVDIDPGVPAALSGDEARLRQVLLNLLNNAIKFTSAGHVALTVTSTASGRDGEELRFTVEDTGTGIPADKLDRLFKRFSQVDASIKRQFGGTGLGLAISKRLVELMGGQIGVHSQDGEGSSFWFTVRLPRASLDSGPVHETSEAARAPIAARILLAEDLELNQDLACRILRNAGHEVDVVSDGAAAVMAVQSRIYDLVLMDVQMPGMDGVTATERIRGLMHPARSIPIIALTANVLPKQVAVFKAAGMNDHIGKPFKRDKLLATVDRWLADLVTFEIEPARPSPGPAGFNRTAYDDLSAIVGPRIADWHAKLREQLAVDWLTKTDGGDLGRMASAAHAVVSTAGMLGFSDLSEVASDLEAACLGGEPVCRIVERFRRARQEALEQLAEVEANRARGLRTASA